MPFLLENSANMNQSMLISYANHFLISAMKESMYGSCMDPIEEVVNFQPIVMLIFRMGEFSPQNGGVEASKWPGVTLQVFFAWKVSVRVSLLNNPIFRMRAVVFQTKNSPCLYLEGGLVVPCDIVGVIWGRKGWCIFLFNEERQKESRNPQNHRVD